MEQEQGFWQRHSDRYLIMAFLYEKRMEMPDADYMASYKGVCGDTITIYLKVQDAVISEMSYLTTGCINTNACCNVLAEMIEGKRLADCTGIMPQDLIDDLETLPEDHHHCAKLAVMTLQLILKQAGLSPKEDLHKQVTAS